MKTNIKLPIKLILLCLITFLMLNCSSDDTQGEAVVNVTNLRVLLQNGISVDTSACLNPNDNYFVEITIAVENNVPLNEPYIINYTVNGNTNSVTFTEAGIKTIPASFSTGANLVALVDSGQSLSFTITAPPEFVLVP